MSWLQCGHAVIGARENIVVTVVQAMKSSSRPITGFIGNRFGSAESNQLTNVTQAMIRLSGRSVSGPHACLCGASREIQVQP